MNNNNSTPLSLGTARTSTNFLLKLGIFRVAFDSDATRSSFSTATLDSVAKGIQKEEWDEQGNATYHPARQTNHG
ncbi:hypothetical protein RRF57_002412 [Xylaria bambusicola]|uniref:Uncharacterized protein n=1 Tax=Xylaria bambusicola TaxID=326684 RepID=A0AAN7UF85_9PEZI